MTYDELKQQIIDFTENTDATFESNIPTFVDNAEHAIYNAVRLPALRRNVTGNLTASNKYLTLPSDFLSVFELAVIKTDSSYEYLLPKDVSFIRQAYPTPTSTGTPSYYALFDADTAIVGPTPDDSYSVELHYYYYPPSIVTAGSTYISENFPMVLLYGSLVEAYTFMKGEADLLNEYKQRFATYLRLLQEFADGKVSTDAFRDGAYAKRPS